MGNCVIVNKRKRLPISLHGGDLSLKGTEQEELETHLFKKMGKVSPQKDHKIEREIADHYLKCMLTHPVIVDYFDRFCKQRGGSVTLKFYLVACQLRKLYLEQENRTELAMAYGEILTHQPFSYQNHEAVQLSAFEILNGGKVLDQAMDTLRKAQYEAFFSLKENYWIPFCDSSLYAYLLDHNEIKKFMELYVDPESINDGVSSNSIQIQDKKLRHVDSVNYVNYEKNCGGKMEDDMNTI